jgi:hypothetical protein
MSQWVEVAGGELKKIVVNLPLIQTASRPIRSEASSKITTLTWVGLGATSVLVIGAAATGLWASKSSSDLGAMRFAGSSPSTEVLDQQSKIKTLALTSDLMTGAAVVTFATTMVLTFARAAPAPVATKEARGPVVRPGLGLGSLSISGEF